MPRSAVVQCTIIYCAPHKSQYFAGMRARAAPAMAKIRIKRSSSPKKMVNAAVTINGLVTLAALAWPEVRQDPFAASKAMKNSKEVSVRQALSGIVSKSASPLKTIMILALAMTFVVAGAASSMAARSAAIVIDAKTGKVLYSSDANGRRYPASLTKMMTLYLTFEALAKGRISKNTPVRVFGQCRRRAADQARRQGRRIGLGRDRHPVDGDQVGQRFGDRARRTARRQRSQFRPHDDRQGARARHERHRLSQRQRPARSRPVHHRARHGDARHRAAGSISRSITAISRSAPSSMGASASTATTVCSAASRASTASRPATPAPPASTSSRRFPTATAASSPSSWAARRAAAATTRWPG